MKRTALILAIAMLLPPATLFAQGNAIDHSPTGCIRAGSAPLMQLSVDPKGELRVEILNEAGEAVPRFTVRNCLPVTADTTLHAVRWTGVEDLSFLTNQPVRFRFHLKNGRLFAFWVSPEKKGASHGYVAAGGPGFSSNRDLGGSPGRVQ